MSGHRAGPRGPAGFEKDEGTAARLEDGCERDKKIPATKITVNTAYATSYSIVACNGFLATEGAHRIEDKEGHGLFGPKSARVKGPLAPGVLILRCK